ncbi:MAG: hypothetical protein INQ03_08780 [Candidatus Heimdallarchaeota archaeon]|nr:hypothetical protein [Candidatus Heimdallarchaeota archaeon]
MIKDHALDYYGKVVEYFKLILDGLPEEKMIEPFGDAGKPVDILFHAVATPHWWLKQKDQAFPFSAKFADLAEVKLLLDKQVEEFRKRLNDEDELTWTPSPEYAPSDKSTAWIMIRSAHHMMHHGSMLLFLRKVWGLPALNADRLWSEIADYASDLLYKIE